VGGVGLILLVSYVQLFRHVAGLYSRTVVYNNYVSFCCVDCWWHRMQYGLKCSVTFTDSVIHFTKANVNAFW